MKVPSTQGQAMKPASLEGWLAGRFILLLLHQNLGSSYKTENSVYTTVYNRFFRKHGLFDRRNGQRNRAVTHTPNLSTTFAGIRRRCVRELRRVGQGGVRRFVPKSLSHGADQRARLARQKKPPKPADFDAGTDSPQSTMSFTRCLNRAIGTPCSSRNEMY